MDQQPTPPSQPEQPKPVAYDSEGRPLYAAPPQPQPAAPQFVHFSRAVNPVEPEITPEIKAKHEQSVRDYPDLNLSEAEYVISAVRRHPIGLVAPVSVTIFLTALFASLIINYPLWIDSLGLATPPSFESILVTGGLLTLLILLGGYISVWVYLNNKFFLTNESVIQEIQTSLFARHEQTVSLTNIEDASFVQRNMLQNLFDYGSIRLSTEGDETTYRFHYVAHPKQEIAILNNAVEAFKNGRPVDDSDN